MIDAIQKLGVDYLFQKEIRDALRQLYESTITSSTTTTCQNHHNHHSSYKLHEAALRFRLLRQEGYHVSSDLAFSYFKDKDGKFRQVDQLLTDNDAVGLESLFEASQMSTPSDEDTTTLGEAYNFCLQHLINSASSKEGRHRHRCPALFIRSLKHPDHYKTLERFMVSNKDILNRLKKKDDVGSMAAGWRNDLSELADFELKMTQILHEKEMDCFLKWWKELRLTKDMKFARDQPIKWYTLALTTMPSPSFSEVRMELAKPMSIIYVMDDIFDMSEALDEDLVLFAEAVNRWEFDSIDHNLPDYIRICLKTIFDTTGEISRAIWSKYGWNPQDSLQKQWADLFSAFLVESKWLKSGELPMSEEYLKIGTITSGVPFLLTFMLFLMGEGSLETLDDDYRSIISSTATFFRLCDDLVTDIDEGGLDGSYIQCYMNEYIGTSVDDARQHIIRMISDEWKRFNKYSLLLSQHPSNSAYVFSKICINLARIVCMAIASNIG